MYVKISRSKQLINNRRTKQKVRKAAVPENRCNHCGGVIRHNGELISCLMCSREAGHLCERCSFVTQEAMEKKKKSA